MTSERRPLLNANLRWFLLAMILANIAGQMGYSMLSLYLIDLGADVGEENDKIRVPPAAYVYDGSNRIYGYEFRKSEETAGQPANCHSTYPML